MSFRLAALNGRRRRLFAARSFLFGRRLPVALFQTSHHHVGDELLFTMIVKFYDDPFLAAEHDRAQAETLVFHLGALGEGVGWHGFSTIYSSVGLRGTLRAKVAA